MLNWKRKLGILLGRGDQTPPGQPASTGQAVPNGQNLTDKSPKPIEPTAARQHADTSIGWRDDESSQLPQPPLERDVPPDSPGSDGNVAADDQIEFDEESCLHRYPNVAREYAPGSGGALRHHITHGRRETNVMNSGSVEGMASGQESLDDRPAGASARRIAISFRKSYARRVADGFMGKYLAGTNILDIGFRGGDPDAVPITETAIGIELDYPGYDGTHLPFPAESQDAVLAAHVLEHILNYQEVLQDWHRVLRVGGYLIIMVPHWYLYERRCDLPSRWNGDHKRFYTPGRLLAEIEEALPVNSYRIRHLVDNDFRFDYEQPLNASPLGCYEIELVVEKIQRPSWADKIVYPPAAQQAVAHLDALVFQAVAASVRDGEVGRKVFFAFVKELKYFTPWARLRQRFVFEGAPELNGTRMTDAALVEAVRPLLDCLSIDETVYGNHADLKAAVAKGKLADLTSHWRRKGYFEGRVAHEYDVFS